MAQFYGTLTLAFLLGLADSSWAGVKTLGQPRTFPIVISQPGSYRLRNNITVPDENTTAISVQADDVTIDLNGFAILGPTVCTGSPVTSCAPTGVGNGITTTASQRVTVFNGTVQGMGRIGVDVGPHSRVENVRAVSNGGGGIVAGVGSRVNGNVAARNGFSVSGSDAGIAAGDATLSGNVAEGNQRHGITCMRSTLTGNTVTSNAGCGINDLGSSTLIGNTATLNGSGMCLNDGGGKAGYANNVLNGNNGGNANPQLYGSVEMGTNICGGDTVCP